MRAQGGSFIVMPPPAALEKAPGVLLAAIVTPGENTPEGLIIEATAEPWLKIVDWLQSPPRVSMFGAAQKRERFERSVKGVKPIPLPVGQAVLQGVVEKLGGLYTAAVQLGVSTRVISHYLDATTHVPDALLLRAVDIVLEEFQQSPSGASQPFDRSEP